MLNEKFLVRFITFAPFLVIPLITIIISVLSIQHNQEILDQSLQNIRERLISEQQKSIVSKVNMAIELITYQRSTIEQRLQTKVKDRVDRAYDIAQSIYVQNRGKKNDGEIQSMIIDALRPMVWNKGESFIFILDKSGTFALAPEYLRHLEGESIIDFKDVTGRFVIREEIKLVSTKGDGYLWDTFTRPGYDRSIQFKQMAYVKNFGHFNWYLGSSEYLDTTTKEIEKSSIDILRHINQKGSEYFFIIDTKGNSILHPNQRELENTNLLKGEHADVVSDFLEKARTHSSEFSEYQWKNPSNGKTETKLSYVQTIPNSDWIIGTGFYTDEIDRAVGVKKQKLLALYENEFKKIILFSVFFLLVSLMVSFYISYRLKRHFELLHGDIERHNLELSELNASLEEKIATRTEELKIAHDEMEKLAMTDTLTGIHNRYAFFTMLGMEQEKTDRYKEQFSLIMFDLDNFKKINDTYGHDIGDTVLIEVVKRVGVCLRKSDVFGRVGGEEFMILLPHTDIQTAGEIAERIRHYVSQTPIEPMGTVTISIGVVEYSEQVSLESLIKRSDIALYQAKESGKNKVIIG
ncbi:cache domain-containing protein [Sulfuricurvum sp.]|uniref:sensor domain-containing diguanylate cyclase n=1 Tax=Sulfuricurvum sp. TaxID=2025608 RepID=UPI002624F637|nr:cache domain-containing protein [Sulfuricurvum sp.]MDD2781430.1 cache domain-containing protein [Sulfuricurvum sp.]